MEQDVYQIGDHLISSRLKGLYRHHGIYIGNGKVIHYSGFSKGFKAGKVCSVSLEDFCNKDKQNIRVKQHSSPKFNRKDSVKRAIERLEEDQYDLIFNNCEHFVNYCIEGEAESKQVQYATIFTVFIAFISVGSYLTKRNNNKI